MTNAPKKPQDRKPKAKKIDPQSSIEFEGVTYTLDMEAADDEELLDLAMIADRDPRAGFELARRVLGDDQWDEIIESIRTESGRVPLTKKLEVAKLVMEPLGNFIGSLLS